MKRVVKLKQGWLELDIRTVPRLLRRRALPRDYSVLVTRYDSEGWSVTDEVVGWVAGASRGKSLGVFLAEQAGISLDEAEALASETISEWERRRSRE